MSKKEGKLLKTSIIYAIAQIITQALNFFLLPIYTNKLGTIEYGKYATITSFTGFISTFLILSIHSGCYRFYKEYVNKKHEEDKLINTALNFSYLMSMFVIFVTLIIGKSISKLIFDFENGYKILWIVIITSIISQINLIYMSRYKLEYKAFKVSMIEVIRLIIQFSSIIFFITYNNMGIMGILYGQLFAYIVIYFYLLVVEWKYFKLTISCIMLKNMLIYSIGLLPVNVSGWILQLSDRYFLSNYNGFDTAGIYNLGYQFGMLINPIFITPFLGSFDVYMLENYKKEDAKNNFKNIMRKYNVLGCIIMLGISVFAKTAIYILSNKDFILAYTVVPMVLYSYFLYGKVSYYAFGLQIKNKTYIEGIYMFISAFINIGLNFIIIPYMGMVGAAISTVISYFIINLLLIKASQKEYKIDLDIKFISSIQVITLIFYLIYLLYARFNFVFEVLLNLIIILLYIILICKLKFIDLNEIISAVKSIFKRK